MSTILTAQFDVGTYILAQNSTDAQDTVPIAAEDTQGTSTAVDAPAPEAIPARGKRAPLAAGIPGRCPVQTGKRPTIPSPFTFWIL